MTIKYGINSKNVYYCSVVKEGLSSMISLKKFDIPTKKVPEYSNEEVFNMIERSKSRIIAETTTRKTRKEGPRKTNISKLKKKLEENGYTVSITKPRAKKVAEEVI